MHFNKNLFFHFYHQSLDFRHLFAYHKNLRTQTGSVILSSRLAAKQKHSAVLIYFLLISKDIIIILIPRMAEWIQVGCRVDAAVERAGFRRRANLLFGELSLVPRDKYDAIL